MRSPTDRPTDCFLRGTYEHTYTRYVFLTLSDIRLICGEAWYGDGGDGDDGRPDGASDK